MCAYIHTMYVSVYASIPAKYTRVLACSLCIPIAYRGKVKPRTGSGLGWAHSSVSASLGSEFSSSWAQLGHARALGHARDEPSDSRALGQSFIQIYCIKLFFRTTTSRWACWTSSLWSMAYRLISPTRRSRRNWRSCANIFAGKSRRNLRWKSWDNLMHKYEGHGGTVSTDGTFGLARTLSGED